jgi:guanylate kinase
METKAKIIAIMGKSGSGKSCLKKALMEYFDFIAIQECTDRPMRPDEIDGVDYLFLNSNQMLDDNIVCKKTYHTRLGDWAYGIIKTELQANKNYVIVINPYQVEEFNKIYSDVSDIIYTIIETDEEKRILQLIKREEKKKNPNYAEICRRIGTDSTEFSKVNDYWKLIKEPKIIFNSYEESMKDIAYEFCKNIR